MEKTQISNEYVGQRLDIYLVSVFPELSRAQLQKLLKSGRILINEHPGKASYILRAGDYMFAEVLVGALPIFEPLDIPILYEDDDCLVINKPLGVLTHSKGAYNPESTVATFVQQHSKMVEGERAGIAHRLDRATSGVMICAKTPDALSWLQKQFAQRRVKKSYIAIIEGTLEPDEAIIDIPIERNPKKPQTFRAGSNGKPSQTHYKVLETNSQFALVELKPVTGRTHQLRVHLKHFDHPIVGDTLYGGLVADRLYLHAHSLEITLPNRQRKVFKAAIPPEFKKRMEDGAHVE